MELTMDDSYVIQFLEGKNSIIYDILIILRYLTSYVFLHVVRTYRVTVIVVYILSIFFI